MATQKVIDKILLDARREAQDITNKYRAEAARINDAYKQRIDARKQEIETEAEAAYNAETLRRIAQKRLEMKKRLTADKQELISEVIAAAIDGLPGHKKYLTFLKNMIKGGTFKQGDLLISRGDMKRFLKDLENFLKTEGLEYEIKEDKEMKGGIILNKDKKSLLGSLTIIRELLGEELNSMVAKILFERR